jgi:hypothetical protein
MYDEQIYNSPECKNVLWLPTNQINQETYVEDWLFYI